MKMKLTPRPKTKIKLRTKLLIGGAIVTAASLFGILSGPGSSSSRNTSFNSARCLFFNGTSSGVDFSNNDPGLGSGNKMTVTAWVKWNNKTTAGQNATIMTLNNSSGNKDVGQFWLQHNAGNSGFEFSVQSTSAKSDATGTTNPGVGTWYHIAGVYDGSFIYLYVNGIQEAKTALTGNINNYQGNFKLAFGKWTNASDNYRRFCGDIDEVSLWNIALTQTQIRDMMCKSLAGNEAGLSGYWRMNESSGTAVSDLTSNARNGTSVNTTIVMSGAPVGDASTYAYGKTTLSLSDPAYGDSIVVNNFSSAPAGIHLYRIDTLPNYTVLPSGYSSLSSNYYYGVFIINPNGETYKVNYYYKGNPGIHSQTSLGIISRLNNSSNTWADVTAVLDTTGKSLTKTLQTGRNEYIPALKATALPIELSAFNVKACGNHVVIDWVTASESNNDFFTVERAADGSSFMPIGKVKGAGNSSSMQDYSTTDMDPFQGMSYYRLRQTDFNGKTETFSTVAISFVQNKTENVIEIVKAYPNPFRHEVHLDLNLKIKMDIHVEIMDISGRSVYTESMEGVEGDNKIELYPGAIPDGNYILNVSGAGGCAQSVKIIKR